MARAKKRGIKAAWLGKRKGRYTMTEDWLPDSSPRRGRRRKTKKRKPVSKRRLKRVSRRSKFVPDSVCLDKKNTRLCVKKHGHSGMHKYTYSVKKFWSRADEARRNRIIKVARKHMITLVSAAARIRREKRSK